ncbi:hypothetical protein M436DRAFT_80708 [Aureobasidium namibiae CBS 147.97]|uniref:Uncharacterized protein n=1 Tax=Aureobasidium namibiae CBS 147.97 TaxID=1043004 RepID=A0A074WWY7_9PEZI|nr:uncharacterized protein M436DRAFT_80708 [Aureobasidium namibiae CBS 147.97]KEQ74267.1 hypothetical protein M436DRAFT_80708 [Aureobasidium namibiae CBS 147.97]
MPTKEETVAGYEGSKEEFFRHRAEKAEELKRETEEVDDEVRDYEVDRIVTEILAKVENDDAPGHNAPSASRVDKNELLTKNQPEIAVNMENKANDGTNQIKESDAVASESGFQSKDDGAA